MIEDVSSMKIDYKRLGLFIPVLCIVLTGIWVLSENPEKEKSAVSAAADIENDIVKEKPKVALTFDDGPHPRYTPQLLDGLAERDIKATFFLLGRNIEGREEIVKRINEERHLIGNHSYSHVRLTSLRDEKACEEITKTSEMIFDITGEYPTYVRPPFGAWKTGLDCEEELIPVLWSVDSYDWQVQNTGKIVQKVIKDVEDGDIILMHDEYSTSVESALQIVDYLTEEGYEFVTVDEMIME